MVWASALSTIMSGTCYFEYLTSLNKLFWVDLKKRGGSKKILPYFFLPKMDPAHKKNDRSRVPFCDPTFGTPRTESVSQ